VAAEGLVGLVAEGTRGAIVELNTETDFVARTEAFQNAAAAFARIALRVDGDRRALQDAPAPDGDGHVADVIARLTARTGEKVNLRRSVVVSVGYGVVASYVHGAAAPGVGRIGVLVALGLYLFVILRSVEAARLAKDRIGAYLVGGIISGFAFQVIYNVTMSAGLAPVKGLTLPLMSYGGSSMIATLAGFGLILNVRMRRFTN